MNPAMRRFLEERLALLPFAVTPEQLLSRDAPGGLGRPGAVSANGSCHMLRARDGWVALNLARPDDRDLVPALTGGGEGWPAIGAFAEGCDAAAFVAAATQLHLPAARLGEAAPIALAASGGRAAVRVIDLSALWAGPLCAGLLAAGGAQVVRIESRSRPDPTASASPRLDRWLNGAKAPLSLDLREARDRARLHAEIAIADVVVTSARPAALERIGLTPAILDAHPSLVWVAITAHGWQAERVGFGDDCAVAGGLVRWNGTEPRFLGDALADPLSGLEGALWALNRLACGTGGLIDLPLAGVAASYARTVSP